MGLVALFPAAYLAYHLERVQPFADHISNVIIETLIEEGNATGSGHDDRIP